MYKLSQILFIHMASLMFISYVISEPQEAINTKQVDTETNDFTLSPEFESIQHKSKYLASIRLNKDDDNFGKGHICSGALIAPSVVLTVGHCLYDYERNFALHPAELKIVLGTTNRYIRTKNTLVYGVTHIYRPKTFDPHTLRDNIAVIMLERDVPELHPTAEATTLYSARLEHLNINDNVPLAYELIGWNDFNGLKSSYNYQKLSEESGSYCAVGNKKFHESGNFYVNSKDSLCHKDDGAPLLHGNQLAGLNVYSGNNECTKQMLPAVFVNVTNYEKWIYEQIGDGRNHNSSTFGILGFILFTLFTIRASNLFKF